MKKLIFAMLCLIVLACKKNTKENSKNGPDDQMVIQATKKKIEQTPLSASMKRGKEIYNELCMTCHLPNGKGVAGTYPPLDGSDWLTQKRTASIHAVKFGLQGPITVNGNVYDNIMTPLGLSDKEIADVMNYIMNTWSNKNNTIVTEEEVAKIKEN